MYTIPVMEGGTNMLEDKVRDVFSDMVVLKNPERTEFFSNLSLPSYMRDWLVMKFSDDDGIIDYDSVLRYIRQYIPSREDFEQFKFEMVNGETVRFLARIRVNVDIKTGKTLFELPDLAVHVPAHPGRWQMMLSPGGRKHSSKKVKTGVLLN